MVQDEGRVCSFGVCVGGWLVLCLNETEWEKRGGVGWGGGDE